MSAPVAERREESKLSLILASVGRDAEARRFLDSLAAQDTQDLELIVVDQNPDDRLVDILAPVAARFPVRHLRLPERGVSRARNRGLALARGDLLCFPDDDCLYPPGLLRAVVDFLANARTAEGRPWDAVVGRILDLDHDRNALPYCGHDRAGELDLKGAYELGLTPALFCRAEAVAGHRFDESLGPGAGTRWRSGEDIDYLMRLVAAGGRVFYNPALIVRHPSPHAVYGLRTLLAREFHCGRANGLVTGRLLGAAALGAEALPNLWYVLLNLGLGRFKDAACIGIYSIGLALGQLDRLRKVIT